MPKRPFEGTYLYQNNERTSYLLITKGHFEDGPIAGGERGGQPVRRPTDEIFGGDAYDCSTIRYSCVQLHRMILAIPRISLDANSSYAVNGTEFSVRECLRQDGPDCRIALVEADCKEISGTDNCKATLVDRSRALHPGPLTYFIFSREHGITSLGFADERPTDKCWIAKLARDYVLRGDVGILKQ
jgi:hypothetical protein